MTPGHCAAKRLALQLQKTAETSPRAGIDALEQIKILEEDGSITVVKEVHDRKYPGGTH